MFYAVLPYVCFPFFQWVSFVVAILDRLFFSFERQKSGRYLH